MEFDIIYDLIMRAKSVEEIKEIRKRVGMKMNPRSYPRKPETESDRWVSLMEKKYGIK